MKGPLKVRFNSNIQLLGLQVRAATVGSCVTLDATWYSSHASLEKREERRLGAEHTVV